jgi:hypothetical protein
MTTVGLFWNLLFETRHEKAMLSHTLRVIDYKL